MNRQRRAEVAEFRQWPCRFQCEVELCFLVQFFLMAKPFTLYPISFSTNEARVDGGIFRNFSVDRSRRRLSTWLRSSRGGFSPQAS